MTDFFKFEWGVDQDGYELEDISPLTSESGTFRSKLFGDERTPEEQRTYEQDGWTKRIHRRGGPLRFYRPMEQPGLWRRLVDVGSTPAGALEFVSEFGLLHDNGKETLAFVLNTARLLGVIRRALDHDDPDDAAILFNRYSPRVTAMIGAPRGRLQRLSFDLVPLSLGSALLIQAGNEITGDLKFRRCLNCPEWFQIGSGAATIRRKFCSDRCRIAWSRKHVSTAAT